MKSGSKNIIVGFSILTLVGVALIAFFFLKIKNNVETMYAAEALAEATAASTQESQTLEQLVSTLQPEISSLNSRVVSSDGAAAFIEMIESLARTSGLQVTISSVSDSSASGGSASPTGPGSYQLLTLDVSTEGSWKNTHNFLSLLETLPYKVDLSLIGLSANSQGIVEPSGSGSGGSGQSASSQKTGSSASAANSGGTGSVWNGQFTLNVLQEM